MGLPNKTHKKTTGVVQVLEDKVRFGISLLEKIDSNFRD